MDLTKIEKPYGLLDAVTQQALEDHHESGGVIQYYIACGWSDSSDPHWLLSVAYRAKPEPVVKEYTHKLRVSSGVYDWTPPLFSENVGHGWIDGTTTATVVDGKPTRIVWEADQ